MATGTPTLHPNPMLRGGQTLSASDGWLVVTKPNGKSARYAIGAHGPGNGGSAGVATLAHARTSVRPPVGDAVPPPGVARSSWSLLDVEGRTLVWLANTDQALYDVEQAREFAAAAGLEFRDVGASRTRELTSARPASALNGPGTGRPSALVAPGRQWGLTLAALAGMLLTVPIVAVFWTEDPSASRSGEVEGVGGLIVLVAFFTLLLLSFWVAGRLSGGLAALRWRRYWRVRRIDSRTLLTARRLPGLALGAAPGGGLEIRDLRYTHTVGRGAGIALQPYEIAPDASRPPSGLLVRNPTEVVAHVEARFDPGEVDAFAGAVGARSLPPLTHAEQVPKPRSRTRRGGRGGPSGRFVIGKPSLYAWGTAAWILTVLSPALVVGAVALAVGWVDLWWAYAAWCAGAGSLVASAWALYLTQTPVHLRRPGVLAPRAYRDPRAGP